MSFRPPSNHGSSLCLQNAYKRIYTWPIWLRRNSLSATACFVVVLSYPAVPGNTSAQQAVDHRAIGLSDLLSMPVSTVGCLPIR